MRLQCSALTHTCAHRRLEGSPCFSLGNIEPAGYVLLHTYEDCRSERTFHTWRMGGSQALGETRPSRPQARPTCSMGGCPYRTSFRRRVSPRRESCRYLGTLQQKCVRNGLRRLSQLAASTGETNCQRLCRSVSNRAAVWDPVGLFPASNYSSCHAASPACPTRAWPVFT